MPKVAVVILNYNGRNYLEQFLPAVLQHSTTSEVIVADNASTDDSIRFLEKQYPNLSLIKLTKNFGFAGGYNQALKQVEADYFVLLNSDVEVSQGWLDPMITFLDQNPKYAACQPKILDYRKRTYFEYAGAAGGYLDKYGYPFCRGRIFDTVEQDNGQYDDETDISWATGACFVIRSQVFLTNQFDEDFFAHMEEIDLCWRLNNLGHKIRYVPDSMVYHVGGGTLDQSSAYKTFLNFRNSLNVLIKNLPLPQLLWKLPFRWFLDWLAIFRFFVSGNFNHGKGVLKAHFSVLMNIGHTFRKRNQTGSSLLGNFSIVFKYFFKGKKTYSSI